MRIQLPFRAAVLSRNWKRLMQDEFGNLKPEAARVLADLRDFCEDESTRRGEFNPADNEQALAYARRRETLSRIMNFLDMDDHELAEIQQQRKELDE